MSQSLEIFQKKINIAHALTAYTTTTKIIFFFFFFFLFSPASAQLPGGRPSVSRISTRLRDHPHVYAHVSNNIVTSLSIASNRFFFGLHLVPSTFISITASGLSLSLHNAPKPGLFSFVLSTIDATPMLPLIHVHSSSRLLSSLHSSVDTFSSLLRPSFPLFPCQLPYTMNRA